jgi:rRNA maturation endonuclease Nob1
VCFQENYKLKISTPNDLKKAVKLIKRKIANGNFDEVKNLNNILERNNIPFQNINDNGPWDDIISYTFRCSKCHNFYRLSVETYHGSGGELKSIGLNLD